MSNDRFYGGELQNPIITVSPDNTSKGSYGWCTSQKVWVVKNHKEESNNGFYEINICAEYLARPFTEICETLFHEMVHLYNLQIDVKDTSRNGWYHNKKFMIEAEKRGLNVEKDTKYGWAKTSLNPEAQALVDSLGGNDFMLYRSSFPKICKNSKSSSRKYICPSCGLIIRATKEVHVSCIDCNMELVEAE